MSLLTVNSYSEFHLYTDNNIYDNVGSQLPYNHNAFLTYKTHYLPFNTTVGQLRKCYEITGFHISPIVVGTYSHVDIQHL